MRRESELVMRLVVCATIVMCCAGVSLAQGSDVAALRTNPATIAAKYDGLIQRPRVCPVDSAWVAFEVVRKASVQLYIYNTTTHQETELQPPVPVNGAVDTFVVISNDYLDWRPESSGGKIWAAFVSDVSGSSELYLYEVTTNKYYELTDRGDSTRYGEKIDLAWSPDGRVLAYSSNMHGNYEIYVLRGMDKFLKNPANSQNIPAHELCVYGRGDARAPAWAPCEGCGYLAYTSIDKKTDRSRIFVADLRPIDNTSISYGMTGAKTGIGYFAPAWSPDGRRLACFQYVIGADKWKLSSGSAGEQCALGVFRVERDPEKDELSLVPVLGGESGTSNQVLYVARNNALFQPPVWLPDGKGLVVPEYQQDTTTRVNPYKMVNSCKVVDLTDWTEGVAEGRWLKGLGNATDEFDFPLDATITGQKLSFTCLQGQARVLVVGQLQPQESYAKPLDPLPCKDRVGWWNRWSKGEKDHGGFVKVARALVNPVAGSKYLLVNRPIVPLAGVAIWLLAQKASPPAAPRDWSIPGLPSSAAARGFHLSVGI